MKTYSPKPGDIERRWYVLDASGAVLGRLATQAASILRGKHKPIFAPHADTGDHVIVINAKGVTLSGGKGKTKIAYRHSGYPGGLTETPYERLLATKPAFAVEKAIKGMLPHNRLGRQMATKLRVYAGPEHRHEAQQPQPLGLGEMPTWGGLPQAPEPEAPKAPARRATTTAPPAKRSTAKRATAKPTAAKTTAKRPSAKTVGTTAKRTAAKKTTAKRTAAKTTAKSATAAKKPTVAKKPTARSKRSTKKES